MLLKSTRSILETPDAAYNRTGFHRAVSVPTEWLVSSQLLIERSCRIFWYSFATLVLAILLAIGFTHPIAEVDDNLKVRVGDEWVRVMSDSDNEENGPADGFEEPKAMRKGNPLRGSERQCAKIMARVERKREPERSVPRILAIVTSYRRWVVLLHNHSISLLLL
jgi:hypothetical protein